VIAFFRDLLIYWKVWLDCKLESDRSVSEQTNIAPEEIQSISAEFEQEEKDKQIVVIKGRSH
jgi:hypothetical protein